MATPLPATFKQPLSVAGSFEAQTSSGGIVQLGTDGAVAIAAAENRNVTISASGTGRVIVNGAGFANTPGVVCGDVLLTDSPATFGGFFTPQHGAVYVTVEGVGDGGTASDASAVFAVCRALSAAARAQEASRVASGPGAQGEELMLRWAASGPLELYWDSGEPSYGDPSYFSITLITPVLPPPPPTRSAPGPRSRRQ